MKKTSLQRKKLRKNRIRAKIKGSSEQPRLVVFRSLTSCSAQFIDDENSVTLLSGSEKDLPKNEKLTKTERAKVLGIMLGKKAVEKGIIKVVFDRGGNAYHGRVAAFAEGAREGGLVF